MILFSILSLHILKVCIHMLCAIDVFVFVRCSKNIWLADRPVRTEQGAREPSRLIGKRFCETEIKFEGTVFGSNTGKLFPFANKPCSTAFIILSHCFPRFCGISLFVVFSRQVVEIRVARNETSISVLHGIPRGGQ